MLDFAKNLGVFDEIIFYGDHEADNIVYYLPDELGFSKTSTAGGETDYELMLQLFKDGQSIEGGIDELKKNSGGILSLGVQCGVTELRLEAALEKLVKQKNLPDDTSAALPSWERGKVDLIVLDSTTQDDDTMNDESFVKRIIGSKSPSLLTSDLKSIFNVRLDHRGAAMIASSLAGERGHIAGVLYDMQFRGIQPALDLRIWADLERCYKTISHKLSIKAEFTYYVKFSLGADFEKITREMEENGDLKIEVLSQVTDPQMKQLVDETVKQTKEKVLRELFQPMVNPGIDGMQPISLGLEEAIPKVGVAYQFKHISGVQKRVIDLDFRKRSATMRHHNPQAHLWMMGHQIDHDLSKYSKMVSFSDLWRMHEVGISMVHDFDRENNDLLAAEVLVWRSKDGLAELPENKAGVFSMPNTANPIASFSFTKESHEKKKVAWNTEADEPDGYYYQVRFVFDNLNSEIDTPEEIITDPELSYSRDLPLILNALTMNREVRVLRGNVDFNQLSNVNLRFFVQNENDEILDQKLFLFQPDDDEILWRFRRKEGENIFVTEEKEFHFKENLPSISSSKRYLTNDEIILNSPFPRSGRTIMPVLVGDKSNIHKIWIRLQYQPQGITEKIQKTVTTQAPNFELEDIIINGVDNNIEIEYEIKVLTTEGKIIPLTEGTLMEEALLIDLKELNSSGITIIWRGSSPEDQDLRRLTVELAEKNTAGDFNVLQEIKYRGSDVPGDKELDLTSEFELYYKITRRFSGGESDRTEWIKITGDEIIIDEI